MYEPELYMEVEDFEVGKMDIEHSFEGANSLGRD